MPVNIIGVGGVSCVGANIAQIASSTRAQITRIREVDEWQDKHGEPFRGGFLFDEDLEELNRKVHDVPPDDVPARLLQLGGAALKEFADVLFEMDAVPVIVGVADAEQLPDRSPELFLDNLMRQAQIRLDLAESEVIVAGRIASLVAIHKACRLLEQGHPGPILAGGIDSYYDHEKLIELDFDGRILNEGNLDGFLPGEGAGFVLLSQGQTAQRPLMRIVTTMVSADAARPGTSAVLPGDTLAQTLNAIFQSVPAALLPCRTVYANLNGENRGGKEWGVAYLRNRQSFSEDHALLHPAEYFGDAGAAMGAIMTGFAVERMRRNNQGGPFLVWCSNDQKECAALYMVAV